MGFYEFSSPYDWSRIAEYKRTAGIRSRRHD